MHTSSHGKLRLSDSSRNFFVQVLNYAYYSVNAEELHVCIIIAKSKQLMGICLAVLDFSGIMYRAGRKKLSSVFHQQAIPLE